MELDYTQDMEGVGCSLSIEYDQQVAAISNSSLAFVVNSRNEALIFVTEDLIDERKRAGTIFEILSYCILAVFVASLAHKMIGAEMAVCCQIVYTSFALYPNPTYLSRSGFSFRLVTGFRGLFFRDEYEDMLPPFCSNLEISRQVAESSIVWCGLLLVLLLLLLTVKVHGCFNS